MGIISRFFHRKDLSLWAVLAFFALFLAVGLAWYDDYGISSDEQFQMDKSRLALDYVLGRNDQLLSYADRHYGALFPLVLDTPLAFTSDTRAFYMARHLLNFLFWYLGVVLFYKLLRRYNWGRWIALGGTALLALHPHLFGHGFFNPKDIPYLVVYIAALYTLDVFLRGMNARGALLHGFASGMLVVFRLPGVLVWAGTALMMLLLLLAGRAPLKRLLGLGLVYVLAAFTTLYVFLPALWHDPLGEMATFLGMDLFVWAGKELLMGTFYKAEDLPWYHLPAYLAVCTPPLVLGLFAAGHWFTLARAWADRRLQYGETLQRLAPLVLFWLSMAVLLATKPLVYNGWRHIYFLYPLMLLVALDAAAQLPGWLQSRGLPALWAQAGSGGAVLAQVLLLLVFILQSHPYEFVYYNLLAGRSLANARTRYIMDYWGLSYREAFEKILAADKRPHITIMAEREGVAIDTLMMLQPWDRARVKVVSPVDDLPWDYFVTPYRNDLTIDIKRMRMVDSITVRGALVSGTYVVDKSNAP